MRRGRAVLLMIGIVCGLAGCGQDELPEVSTVSIGKDGGIVQQIVGSFEQDYYDMDSLKALASQRVTEYCADSGADSVALASVEEKDGSVLICFNYATDRDYKDFNNRELFVGTLLEAGNQGYGLEGVAFVSADGKPMELGYMEDHDKTKIVIIGTKPSEELVVNTYGKVLYINQTATSDLEVSFAGKKGVRITHPAKEDSDESALSYIVFQ
ncbi:MAG: hypothetical protein K2K07_03620 [Lachnospiraceae bacterium]|nr:hypothetical protein [Lachnospiraceae bacterium]